MTSAVAVLLWLLCAFCASIASSQQVSAWLERGEAALGTEGLVLVVDSLDEQLARPGGAMTVGIVQQSGFFDGRGDGGGSIGAAWEHLAEALEIDADEAARRLLGDRVVVVFPVVGLPLANDWAVATRVSRHDVWRALKGLNAVQREVVSGAPVYSVERGAYRLSVVKVGDDRRVMVLGPGNGGASFVRMVRGLSTPAGQAWFASEWPVRTQGGVIARMIENGAVSVAFAQTHEHGWRGVVVSPAELPADTPLWREADAAMLIDGASLGMVGSVTASSLSESPLSGFLGMNDGAARSLLGDEPRRGVLRIETDEQGLASVRVGVETRGDVSSEGDETLRGLVAVVTGSPDKAPDFEGCMPDATRSADLAGGFVEGLGLRLVGEQPRLAWGYSSDDEPAWMAVSLGNGGDAVGGVRPVLGELGRVSRAQGMAMNDGLVSAGCIRPAPIGSLLERVAGLEQPVLVWTPQIESVTWRTRLLGEDRVRGTFEVVLRGQE